MTNEEIITDFMRKHYTDEKLAALLAHIEDGKFSFVSCCCLKGTVTAKHALRGRMWAWEAASELHLWESSEIPGGNEAEIALKNLLDEDLTDASAQTVMLPLVRAEIERRERERSESSSESLQRAVLSV